MNLKPLFRIGLLYIISILILFVGCSSQGSLVRDKDINIDEDSANIEYEVKSEKDIDKMDNIDKTDKINNNDKTDKLNNIDGNDVYNGYEDPKINKENLENKENHEAEEDMISDREGKEVLSSQTVIDNKLNSAVKDNISSASPALTMVDTNLFSKIELQEFFHQSPITEEIAERIHGISYKEDCQVPKEELTYLKVLHYGFDEKTYIGEIIVNKAIAEDVLDIFRELYEAKYPIEKMVLVDTYNADDNLSMADNNSSSFNYRVIDGTTKLSKHSRGLAIDINPLYNPYVRSRNGKREVLPVEGAAYADRGKDCVYYIKENDVCYQAFIKRGFSWGGNWNSSKDYQHFDITID